MTDEEKEKYRDGLIATCKVYCHIDYDDDMEILELMFDVTMQEMTELIPNFDQYSLTSRQKLLAFISVKELYDNRDKYRSDTKLLCCLLNAFERNIRRCSTMTGRIKIIRKVSSVVDGRRQQEETEFYSCWCEVKSLGTNEKYTALQTGLENTIVFETRTCDKMEEIRLNLKEFYAVYKGVEFKIYDASPMFTDDRKYQLKCRAGA